MDADVSFHGLDYNRLASSDISSGVKPCRFAFKCPLHPTNRCDGLLLVGGDMGDGTVASRATQKNGKPAMWDWDGNVLQPTFTPSINCRTHTDDGRPAAGCGWHGFIQGGKLVGA